MNNKRMVIYSDHFSFSRLLEGRKSVIETVCDVYMISQESHYVGILDSPPIIMIIIIIIIRAVFK